MTLLAAYNFDEASGNVLDVTGNGYDFPISGNTVRTASGHTNSGLTQIAAATAAGPSPTGLQTTSRTWMTWIQFTAAINGWILEFHNSGANTGVWGLLDISGTLRFRAKDSSNNVYESTAINRDLGTWQHIAATHDGANLKLYINGVLQSTTPMAAPVWTADVLNVLDQTGAEVIIDDVRFYDQALDAATITTLMGTPVAPSAPTVSGTITAVLPAFTGAFTGNAAARGTAAGPIPAMTGSFTGTAAARGSETGNLPALVGAFAGHLRAAGTADGVLPALAATLTGSAEARGNAAGPLPGFLGSFSGSISSSPAGHLDAFLPALHGGLVGAVGPLAPYTPITDPSMSIRSNDATATARANPATATIRANSAEAAP